MIPKKWQTSYINYHQCQLFIHFVLINIGDIGTEVRLWPPHDKFVLLFFVFNRICIRMDMPWTIIKPEMVMCLLVLCSNAKDLWHRIVFTHCHGFFTHVLLWIFIYDYSMFNSLKRVQSSSISSCSSILDPYCTLYINEKKVHRGHFAIPTDFIIVILQHDIHNCCPELHFIRFCLFGFSYNSYDPQVPFCFSPWWFFLSNCINFMHMQLVCIRKHKNRAMKILKSRPYRNMRWSYLNLLFYLCYFHFDYVDDP